MALEEYPEISIGTKRVVMLNGAGSNPAFHDANRSLQRFVSLLVMLGAWLKILKGVVARDLDRVPCGSIGICPPWLTLTGRALPAVQLHHFSPSNLLVIFSSLHVFK